MYHDPLSGYRNARGVPSRAMPDYIHSDYMFMIYKSGCMCFHTEAAVYIPDNHDFGLSHCSCYKQVMVRDVHDDYIMIHIRATSTYINVLESWQR